MLELLVYYSDFYLLSYCRGIDASHMGNRKKLTFRTIFSNLKDLLGSINEAIKNKPFMKLCGATFLVFNGFQIVASFSFFIICFLHCLTVSYEATVNMASLV